MKRINQKNINTPDLYDGKVPTSFGITDMERLWKLVKHMKEGSINTYADVGCNDSIMPALMAERGNIVCAFDHSKALIDFLAPRFPASHYQVADCYNLPIKGDFDYIVAGELIEHLEKPQEAIDHWMSKLNIGGWLAISTPFEEQGGEVGGAQHLWSYTVQDMYDFGFTEVEVLQEVRHKTILAWKQK